MPPESTLLLSRSRYDHGSFRSGSVNGEGAFGPNTPKAESDQDTLHKGPSHHKLIEPLKIMHQLLDQLIDNAYLIENPEIISDDPTLTASFAVLMFSLSKTVNRLRVLGFKIPVEPQSDTADN